MTDPQELSRRLRQRGKEIRTLNIGVGSALAEANVTLLNEAASLIDAHAARIAELETLVDLICEEAAKDNAPLGRSDTIALNRIRLVLPDTARKAISK